MAVFNKATPQKCRRCFTSDELDNIITTALAEAPLGVSGASVASGVAPVRFGASSPTSSSSSEGEPIRGAC